MPILSRQSPAPPDVTPIVRRAWRRYLAETRDADPDDYPAIEVRAWRKLTSTLAALGVEPGSRGDR